VTGRKSYRGTFADFQPRYAEHGIAAIPIQAPVSVRIKKPCIKKPQLQQIADSARLVRQFPNAGVGFWAGKGSRITVLDVDSSKEADLADAMARFGQSPFVVRTPAKGGFHAYYRHNGEPRDIGFEPGRDLLGSGLVILPPTSCVTGRNYEIIHGSIDDLDHLPFLRDAPKVPKGNRNKELWAHCMRHAPWCDSFNDLLDVAVTFSQQACQFPLRESEVVRTARSAWEYTENGLNRFGRTGAHVATDEVNRLLDTGGMDAVALITWLRAHNAPKATFMIANGLAKHFGWGRLRLAAARKHLLITGIIRRAPSTKGPLYFRFKGVEK
jgi:hypothetical protein